MENVFSRSERSISVINPFYIMAAPKIIDYGFEAEKMVHRHRAAGKSYRQIAAAFEEEFGEAISHSSVRRYFEQYSTRQLEMLGQQELAELQKEKQNELIDVSAQLAKVNQQLNEAMDELDPAERDDMRALIPLSGELLRQLHFTIKYLRPILEKEPKPDESEILARTIEEIQRLEDEGLITIHEDKIAAST